MQLEEKIAQELIKRHHTLAVAESCTGGLLSHQLTNIPGASTFFLGGVVAYDNRIKIKILKVPASTIKKDGAVSHATALSMAKSTRALFKTDYGIGITGIAGPSGGSVLKPVGLVFIALSSTRETICKQYHFKGTRLKIKNLAAQAALRILRQILAKN